MIGRQRKNPVGDPIFMSKDDFKKVRWDWNNQGNDLKHMHFQELKNGKWKDVVKGNHRIYFKGK